MTGSDRSGPAAGGTATPGHRAPDAPAAAAERRSRTAPPDPRRPLRPTSVAGAVR